MAIKNIVNEALSKPMSRKEFLAQTGSLLLAVIGVTSILHALSGGSKNLDNAHTTASAYGSSVYGG